MHPMVSGFTLEKLGLHVVLPVRVGKRLDKILLCHQIQSIQIRRPHVISFVADFFFFFSGEQIKKYLDLGDAHKRKSYPERKSFE